MKILPRILALLAALLMMALPALAEDYEDGNPPIAPELQLPSNPSTGYRWMYECDDAEVLSVCEHGFRSNAEGLLGAGGYEGFRLDGAEEGFANIIFRYGRSWEDQPLFALVYQVIVDADLNVTIFQMEMQTY